MITAEETHQKFHQLTQGRWQQERRFFFFRNPSTNSTRLSAGYEMKQPTTETLCGPFQHNIRNSTSLLWKPTTYSTMASNEEYVDSHFGIFPSTTTSDLSPLLSLLLGHQDSTSSLGPVRESLKPVDRSVTCPFRPNFECTFINLDQPFLYLAIKTLG